MLYENILKNVSKCITLTAEETEQFTGMLTTKKVPKKTMLLEEGEICQFEGYLQKGCVRIYYLDENGFEVTLAFAVEDWWISDIASFHYHTPSSLYMETLEDSEFLMLTPDTKERLLETIPKFERVFRMLVQRRLAVLQNRLIHSCGRSIPRIYRALSYDISASTTILYCFLFGCFAGICQYYTKTACSKEIAAAFVASGSISSE